MKQPMTMVRAFLGHCIAALVLMVANVGGVHGRELTDQEREDLFAYELFVEVWNIPIAKREREFAELRDYFFATGELALITLDRSKSKQADRALAYMGLLGLDASFSELHTCAIQKRGKKMIPHLLEARKAYASGRCELPESKIRVKHDRCGDAKTVEPKLRSLLAVADSPNGESCD